ncbi:MAG TPA: transcriptional regulator GcvA [Aliidongia sp.]|uniref:transcriptional regulator GcvA n=1 Tax=Aliidongia sp. TaxID=1914230 RepID=UPI002DDC9768|nr:transcriptional regulator GcvA [Aliidongia sp.]HEV2674402.1 transcriptional regulator GcvA [Aliidongia sp.]
MDRSLASRLPPLAAVRVFEAAARHLSFTRAAVELGMTQAAVSYQIKQLEDRVGTPLFRRLTRKLELTETGQRLAGPVADALGLLANAFAAAHGGEDRVLKITTMHTFASNWLVPRLGRFERLHPDIAVWLDTSIRLVDLLAEEVDVAIRVGHGDWPGVIAERLMPVALSPMASPALIASIGGVRVPADLLKLPLFREDDDAWEAWFALAGHPVPTNVARGARLDNQQMLGNAAMAGQAVALLNPPFFADELASGRLVQPFPQRLFSRRSYFLAYPKVRKDQPKVRAFRDWILAEYAAEVARAAPAPALSTRL